MVGPLLLPAWFASARLEQKTQGEVMSMARELQSNRPDSIDLIGPDFDYPSPEPARRTLIICAAPRTGSFELCRYLIAAGIGVPHEYFHPYFAKLLAARWSVMGDPLDSETGLAAYLDTLRRKRAQGGVLAMKLQYPQFNKHLRNRHGEGLFDGACVVHLFRPDVTTQYASYRAAFESGAWDFSRRQTTIPRVRDRTNFPQLLRQAVNELDWLVSHDAGFRQLFVLLGIRPIFVTTDDLFQQPQSVVGRIADAMTLSVNYERLEHAIACSASYGGDQSRQNAIAGLADAFRKIAFKKE
jgi:LPS sulfotransferase NodH